MIEFFLFAPHSQQHSVAEGIYRKQYVILVCAKANKFVNLSRLLPSSYNHNLQLLTLPLLETEFYLGI